MSTRLCNPGIQNFILTIASPTGPAVQIANGVLQLDLITEINRIAAALAALNYRGSATFTISSNGDLYWTCIVTFTDANPNGVWNNTNHHAPGQVNV